MESKYIIFQFNKEDRNIYAINIENVEFIANNNEAIFTNYEISKNKPGLVTIRTRTMPYYENKEFSNIRSSNQKVALIVKKDDKKIALFMNEVLSLENVKEFVGNDFSIDSVNKEYIIDFFRDKKGNMVSVLNPDLFF